VADFLFSAEGQARAFRIGNLIYGMDGAPLGQIFAERVYRLDGGFVGSLYRNMVVDKPEDDTSDRPAIRRPPAYPNPPQCRFRNKALGMAFADVFDRLYLAPSAPRGDRRPAPRREEEDDFFLFSSARQGAAG
jgi:hypothetical protein